MTDRVDDTPAPNAEFREAIAKDYEWGFSSDIETDFAPKGLSEDTVRFISAKKNEPQWMLDWRLKAYRAWLEMEEIDWAKLDIPSIDYQDAYYYAAPKAKPKLGSLDEVDPEILRVYEKLGIPIEEQKVLAGVEGARKVAVDAVFDSVSVATTFREELLRAGVIFLSISEAIKEYPELIQKYLGSVVPQRDNLFACLNAAVFSDGTFVYVPEGVRCPMELSTYFRINAENTGQFERTLIVAEKGSYVSYLEGCTAPMRDENQLHAAVVEIFAHEDAEVKYQHRPELVSGRCRGQGRNLQLRHQARAVCRRAEQGQLDPGRDRQCDHLEISVLHPQGRRQRRRILLDRADQQSPAGRHRHQDDPHRQGHALDHRVEGHQRRSQQQHISRAGPRASERRKCPQLHPVRFLASGRATAARTPCPTSRSRTRPRRSSMKRPPARSATTNCSTPCRAGSTRKRRWR